MGRLSIEVYCDGGARGNPGPAGIGYVISVPGRKPIIGKRFLGRRTNNQAEYEAVIVALSNLQEIWSGVDFPPTTVYLDSELVVRQLNGQYRVREENLKILAARTRALIALFPMIRFVHIPRAQNKHADRLVNEAIDDAMGRMNE